MVRAGLGRLQQAVVGYDEAMKEPIHDRLPLDWAMTQCSLCNALTMCGEREERTGRLKRRWLHARQPSMCWNPSMRLTGRNLPKPDYAARKPFSKRGGTDEEEWSEVGR